ncbi:hypothetical protein Bcav_2139 [Beutenbergia cavernae DSM 12333]|uniref:Novel STAND NTPase 5 domain-containing protein n=2 Tax=Beutenbergia TaxID=84756 RepID=C5C6I5_BEUC1|nr:hypothetical protein Bcav_2139 [Beutenbergia cavernae DSM 12333]
MLAIAGNPLGPVARGKRHVADLARDLGARPRHRPASAAFRLLGLDLRDRIALGARTQARVKVRNPELDPLRHGLVGGERMTERVAGDRVAAHSHQELELGLRCPITDRELALAKRDDSGTEPLARWSSRFVVARQRSREGSVPVCGRGGAQQVLVAIARTHHAHRTVTTPRCEARSPAVCDAGHMTQGPRVSLNDVTDAQRLALRRAARNGEYHLLLGAGASMDSTSHTGVSLPGSKKLIQQLCDAFDVPNEQGDLLWRIYDRAVEAAGESRVYSWFRERFWGVKHPYWMEYYARSPWATVWTLNVDDTFESAHTAVAKETSRQVQVLNWDDSFRQGRSLNVVHLHGVVDTEDPRKLVFSLSEYAVSAASRAAWPVNFHDSYGNSPFVILGARLRDEPDIESVVSRRHPTHAAPSFYVARTISRAMHADLTRWGLIPVEMTAEDFVLEWGELTGLDLEHDLGAELELGIRIGQQFTELKSTSSPVPAGHDFLGGDEPHWTDIQNGLAAELEWVTKATLDCNQIGRSLQKSTVIAYTGRRLTGRSTGLLQLGEHLRKASWRTFRFRHEGRIDVEALLAFAADGKALALLFDGAADIADDLDRLATEARLSGASVACVVVDDSARESNILGRISGSNLAHARVAGINGRLSRTDAARLVDTLERVGRLGILEGRPDPARLAHFKGHDLFDAMAQLENAPGFGRRVEHLVQELKDTQALRATLVASYASLVNRRLLVIDASRMIGINSDELVRRIQDDPRLASLVSTDGTDVRTRHRWLALQPTVERMGIDSAAEMLRNAVRSVSSRLNQKSLRERNPTALLVGSFMSHRNLNEAFPGADLDSWYTSLVDVFGSWSARYWEQRAILARRNSRSDANLLAKAESFSLRATELVADTYSFTTLGTVLLEKASRVPFDVHTYYERGLSAFERAASLDASSSNVVTWIAFLRYATKVLERISSDHSKGVGAPDLEDLWGTVRGDWRRTYAQLALLGTASDHVKRDLQKLRQDFESLPLPPDPDDGSSPDSAGG